MKPFYKRHSRCSDTTKCSFEHKRIQIMISLLLGVVLTFCSCAHKQSDAQEQTAISQSANSHYECPNCGHITEKLYNCPLCDALVCLNCADENRYIENKYYSGELQEYLENRGHVVFDEYNDAYLLYVYGFQQGYSKREISESDDGEVAEIMSYDGDKLSKKYDMYRG